MPKQDKVQIINQRRRRPTDALGLGDASGAFVPPGTITLLTGNTVGATHVHELDIEGLGGLGLGHVLRIIEATGEVVDYGVADEDALAGALGSSMAGDVVLLPACQVDGDQVVPAGVTLVGRGRGSVLTGALWLEDGASAESLDVVRTAADSDDLVGLLGPSSGEALARDVHVSLVHTGTGKALGVLGMGGTLRTYGVEEWVHGADGSAWAAASADAGEVELNQGQVLAWRTIWGS